MKVLGNVFTAAVLSVLFSSNAFAVPIFWAGNGHYYDVVAAPGITWADARAAALSQFHLGLQGHLVTITSAAEDAAVIAMIQAQGLGQMWAGGYQNPAGETNPGAGWTWVNGEGTFPGVNSVAPYANWAGGEPNDAYGPGSEQFLGMNFANGWNDEGNLAGIAGYVIEYDPGTIDERSSVVPEPASLALLGTGMVGLIIARRRRRRC